MKQKFNVNKYCKRAVSMVLCLIMIVSLAACSSDKNESLNKPQSSQSADSKVTDVQTEFDEFCDKLFAEFLEDDPFSAHFLVSNPADYGIKYDEDDYTLGDMSLESSTEDFESLQKYLRELNSFSRADLSVDRQITYDIISEYIRIQKELGDDAEIVNLFAPSTGVASNLPTLFSEYEFYDSEDVDEYLMFLKDTKRYMEQCIQMTREQSAKGYFMSDKIADEAIDECKKHYDGKGKELIDCFEEKLDGLNLNGSEKNNYIKKQKEYIEKYYLPAFKSAADSLKKLKGSSENDGGLCNYGAVGNNYYSALVQEKTSSKMTPEDAIELLDGKINDIIKAIIMDSDDYSDYENYKPDFDNANDILNFLAKNVEKSFPAPVTTNYTLKNMSETSENDMTAAYYVKSRIDDISINNIKVNDSSVGSNVTELYSVLAHEGFPGHMYQFTGMFADKDIPNIRKVLDFIGATEGWAQYASDCALQYLDTTDAVKNMISMNTLINYALVARVDLGVNYEGWTIDDTYEYLKSYIQVDDDFENEDNAASQLYDIAVGNPAEYLPYAVGYIKMLDMRDKAEAKLKNKFDEKEYHEFIINLGVAPFSIYESALNKWIKAQK